jgi:hypothetical protein
MFIVMFRSAIVPPLAAGMVIVDVTVFAVGIAMFFGICAPEAAVVAHEVTPVVNLNEDPKIPVQLAFLAKTLQ